MQTGIFALIDSQPRRRKSKFNPLCIFEKKRVLHFRNPVGTHKADKWQFLSPSGNSCSYCAGTKQYWFILSFRLYQHPWEADLNIWTGHIISKPVAESTITSPPEEDECQRNTALGRNNSAFYIINSKNIHRTLWLNSKK